MGVEVNIFLCAGGEGWAVDGWTVEQAQTNLPLQRLRSLGNNNAKMY